jgi:hypothetical protein
MIARKRNEYQHMCMIKKHETNVSLVLQQKRHGQEATAARMYARHSDLHLKNVLVTVIKVTSSLFCMPSQNFTNFAVLEKHSMLVWDLFSKQNTTSCSYIHIHLLAVML